MKKRIAFLMAILTIAATNVLAKDYYVALSPFERPDVAQSYVQKLLDWAVQLDAGDSVLFIDGFNLSTIGRFDVPESAVYGSPRARIAANREPAGRLLKFANEASLPTGVEEPSIVGAILLPQLLRQIAMQPSDEGQHEVIIVASPVYDHPAQKHWSMVGARFPADRNLVASRNTSPYAAADTPTLLNGFRVHIAYDETEGSMNIDDYAFRVQRYFTLFVEAQDGQMVTFTTDVNTALERARVNALAMPHQFQIQDNEQVEGSIYERATNQYTLSLADIRNAGPVSIGLTWDCSSCDLDLYAKSSAGAEVLYYDNPISLEGLIRKVLVLNRVDQQNNGFETVYYTVAINLEELVIAVNFYEGLAPDGINAELRIDVDGKTYAKELHIPANQGNRGQSTLEDIQRKRSSTPQTLLINPLDVIVHD